MKELEQKAEASDFWQEREKAVEITKKIADIREEVANIEALKKEIEDLESLSDITEEQDSSFADLEKHVTALASKVKQEERRTFLAGRYDKNSAFITITAGAGGQDAQDWVTILLRMYERYCQKKAWDTAILHQSFGDPGGEGRIGTKQVSFSVKGSYAYGLLKQENGVHRLVRISPFSAQSLRHTSFASVEVIPEIKEEDKKQMHIKPEDISVDTFRSSGPGGQNVNKRETAVRITHISTGIVVSCQVKRTQLENKERAMDQLLAKLLFLKEQEREEEMQALKGQKRSIEWGSQIRSYVLHPYQMVKDHRTQQETSNAQGVLDGNLDEFIEAALVRQS